MLTGYLQGARQRFTEFGGFYEVALAELPAEKNAGLDGLLVREEPGLITLVALVPLVEDPDLPLLRDALRMLAETQIEDEKAEALVVLLLLTCQPLTRLDYEKYQTLKVHEGKVRVVPWVVDLARNHLFPHTGLPFGTDPDLATLAAPEPGPDPEPATARPAQRHRHHQEDARPWITIGLLAVIVGIWLAMTIRGGSLDATENYSIVYAWGAAARPALWIKGQFWRLLTAVFLHFGALHLIMNSMSLWYTGQAVELFYGRWRTLYIFLVAGVAGSAASAILGGPIVISAGASGAIFGLLGAVVWFRLASPLGKRIAWRPLLMTLVLNLGFGLALYKVIDNWNHMGGLVGGMVAAAAVGVPAMPGIGRAKFTFARPAQLAVTGVLLAAAVATVAGLLPLPGAGRDLAQALEDYDAGRYARAEAGLRKAIDRQPDEPLLHSWLAQTYLQEGKCGPARQAYQRLLALDPEFPDAKEINQALSTCP